MAGLTTRRGYGTQHQKLRAKLAPLVAAGMTRCVRCGEPIRPGQRWALDHSDAPGSHAAGAYYGPSHWACNQAARNRKQRPPAKAVAMFFDTSKH
jgi:hypothetical protein